METRTLAPDSGLLRDRRVSRGLSIRDLEASTGINRGRLSLIERGLMPTLAEHARIETALAVADGTPTECAHCHGASGLPASSVILVGVGSRNICPNCAGALGKLGLEVTADRRRSGADDGAYLAEFHERRRIR